MPSFREQTKDGYKALKKKLEQLARVDKSFTKHVKQLYVYERDEEKIQAKHFEDEENTPHGEQEKRQGEGKAEIACRHIPFSPTFEGDHNGCYQEKGKWDHHERQGNETRPAVVRRVFQKVSEWSTLWPV